MKYQHTVDPGAFALGRRSFLQSGGVGLGALALSTLLDKDAAGAREPRTHAAAQAKNVISIHFVGGPSHLDLFENKPALVQRDGEPMPDRLLEGERFAFLTGHPKLLGSRYQFSRHGSSGLELSELLPHLGGVADELCVIKTVHSEQFNHAPAQLFAQTGFERFGRPSFGSWVSYGLGSENTDLPAFVVMQTGATAGAGNSLWGSGFLPTVHQGVQLRGKGDPVLFLSNPKGVGRTDRRRVLDTIRALNEENLSAVADPEIATRIAQYELAFRMQRSVPELTDLALEPPSIHELYGTKPGADSFATKCLLARRLVERGVRFVQLYDSGWDHHSSIFSGLPRKTKQIDQPIAALIADLRQRGLLDETLVVCSSEFGRTPMRQGDGGKNVGRDHHNEAFCWWLAGGGIRGGTTVGKTDELGYLPVEDRVHVNDIHATVLHLLGIDHEQLTYRFQGRAFRLTDVGGELVEKALG